MRTEFAINLHNETKKALRPIRDYLNIQKGIYTPSNIVRGVRYHSTTSDRPTAIRLYQQKIENILVNIEENIKTNKYWSKYDIQKLLRDTIKTLETSKSLLKSMYDREMVKV